MNKLSKIIITVVSIVIFIILFAIVTGVRTDSGHSTPGILGIILFAGVVGAVKAIWKKDNKDDDDSILQK